MPEFGDRVDVRREAARKMLADAGGPSWSPPATWWNIAKGAGKAVMPWLAPPNIPELMFTDEGKAGLAELHRQQAEQLARQRQASVEALAKAQAFAKTASSPEIVLRGIGGLVRTMGELGGAALLDMPPQTAQQGQELGRNVVEAAGPAGIVAQYGTIAGDFPGSMEAQPVETTIALGAPLATAIKMVRGLRAVHAGRAGHAPQARVPDLEPGASQPVSRPPTPVAAAVADAAPSAGLATPSFTQRLGKFGERLAPVGAALPKFDVSAGGAMTGAILGSAVGAPWVGAALGAALPMGAEVIGKVSPVLGRALARKGAAARRAGDDYRAQDDPTIEAVVQNVTTEPVRVGREMQGSAQQMSEVLAREGMDLDPEVQFSTPQVQAYQADAIDAARARAVGLDQPGQTVELVEPAAATAGGAAHAAKAIDIQADIVATSDMLGELRTMRKAFADEAKEATLGQTQRLNEALAELRATTDPQKKRVLLDEIKQARRDRATADPTVSPEFKQALAELDAAERNVRQKVAAAQRERDATIGANQNAEQRLGKIKADRDALYAAAKQAKEAKDRAQVAFDAIVATRRAAMAEAAAKMKAAAGYQQMTKPIKEVVGARASELIGQEAKAEQLARDTAWAVAKSKQLGDLKKLKAEMLKDEYRASVKRWSDDALRGKAVGNKAEYWNRDKVAAEARIRARISELQAEREAAYAAAKEASAAYNAKAAEIYKKAKANDPDIAEYEVAKKERDAAVAAYKASKDKAALEAGLTDLRGAAGQQALLNKRAAGASESVRTLAETMKAEREARWAKVKERRDQREQAFAEKKAAAESLEQAPRDRQDVAEVGAASKVANEGLKGLRETSAETLGKDVMEARLKSGEDRVALPVGKRPVFPTHPILRQYVDKVTEYSNRHNPDPFVAEEIAREFSSLSQIDTPGIFRDPVTRGATVRRLIAMKYGLDDKALPRTLPGGVKFSELATKLGDELYGLAESQMRGVPQSLSFAGNDALAVAKSIFDNEFDGATRNRSMATAGAQYGKMLANKLQQETQARALHQELTRSRPELGEVGKKTLPANAIAYAAAKELLGDAPHTALWAPLQEIRGKLANPAELAPLVKKWLAMRGGTFTDAQIAAQLKKMAQRWNDGVPLIAQHPLSEYINKAYSHGTVGSRIDDAVTVLRGAEEAYTARITTAEAMANIVKLTDQWRLAGERISRNAKFGMTSGNPAAYVNNIGGNLGQNLVTRGVDPITWASRLGSDMKDFSAWRKGVGDADTMLKWEAINRTGITKAPAFDQIGATLKSGWKSSTVAKSTEKVHDAITATADEAYQTFGDRAFKVEAASSTYDDVMAAAEGLQPGRAVDIDIGDGRAARIGKTDAGKWTINGRDATPQQVAQAAAQAGAALAQHMFVDVERTGSLTQAIRRSSIASIASPFVTWANRARPTPWQRGFLGDALSGPPSPFTWTNDPGVVAAMAAQGMKTSAVRSAIAQLARQESGQPDVLVDSYSWGDGPGSVAVWRDDEGKLFAKTFDQGSAFAPTASLFRLGAAGLALMDSVVASAPQDLFMTKNSDGTFSPVDRTTLTPEQRAQRKRWVRINSRSNVSEKTVLSFINAAGGPVASMWADASTGKGVDAKKVGITIATMFTGSIPFAVYDIGATSTAPGSEVRKRYLGSPDDDRQETESIINYSVRRMLGIGLKPDIPEETLDKVLEIRKQALRKSAKLMNADEYDKAMARAEGGGPEAAYWQRKVAEHDAKDFMIEEATDDLERDFDAMRKKLEAARKVKGKPGWVNLAPKPTE